MVAKTESLRDWAVNAYARDEKLAKGLQALVDIETPVAALVPGAVEDEVNPENLRTYMLAIIREFGELLEEFNWKPWKLSKEVDRESMIGEFADILAFLGIITRYVMLAADCDAIDLAHAYMQKCLVNVDRFEGRVEGYGVEGTEFTIDEPQPGMPRTSKK